MGRSGYQTQPRYLEVSRRNRHSKIYVGGGSKCTPRPVCGDICITIMKAGSGQCNYMEPYNPCGCNKPAPLACDPFVAEVCALEIDEEGWAVFEWPEKLLEYPEGWYNAHIDIGCSSCGVLPLRIGPRCNVIEVETNPSGPDCLGWVNACDDGCEDSVCGPSSGSSEETKIYKPDWM